MTERTHSPRLLGFTSFASQSVPTFLDILVTLRMFVNYISKTEGRREQLLGKFIDINLAAGRQPHSASSVPTLPCTHTLLVVHTILPTLCKQCPHYPTHTLLVCPHYFAHTLQSVPTLLDTLCRCAHTTLPTICQWSLPYCFHTLPQPHYAANITLPFTYTTTGTQTLLVVTAVVLSHSAFTLCPSHTRLKHIFTLSQMPIQLQLFHYPTLSSHAQHINILFHIL